MVSWVANLQDPRREHRLIPILQFVHTQVYKYAFGRPADGLERSVEGEDECGSHDTAPILTADMITMNQPPLTQHISIPKDMSQLSCEAFTAGIVEGVLDGLDVVSVWHGEDVLINAAGSSYSTHGVNRSVSSTHGDSRQARSARNGPRSQHDQVEMMIACNF